jgi:hypothetical protein
MTEMYRNVFIFIYDTETAVPSVYHFIGREIFFEV